MQTRPASDVNLHETDDAGRKSVVVLEYESERGEEQIHDSIDNGHVEAHQRTDRRQEHELGWPNERTLPQLLRRDTEFQL